jgi:hypothetical protein
MRLPLALAAVAVVAVATPSRAVLTPYCTTRLVNAPSGEVASCVTQTLATLQGNPYRTVRIAVATGAVDATLRCPLDVAGITAHVTPGTVVTLEAFDNGYTCLASITATAAGTTAVLSSTHGNKPDPIQ